MSTATDPRYQALALQAASELGAPTPLAMRAILAQWTCELGAGAPWPVPRNNPGNISKCGVQPGISYTVAPGAPNGATCPIVTFATPQTGAHAYAAYLLARMPGALVYLRAGNALAFLATVAAGGYGTSGTCMANVYRSIAGIPIAPGPIPPDSGGSSGTGTTCAGLSGYCLPTGTILTAANVSALAAKLFAWLKITDPIGQAAVLDVLKGYVGKPWTDATIASMSSALQAAAANGQSAVAGVVGNAIAAAPGAILDVAGTILGGLAGALEPVVFLLGIVVLVILGLYLTLSPAPGPA